MIQTTRASDRKKQIERLIDLGFHKQLGLSPEAYGKRFPAITPQPSEYAGRFDLFLVVEGAPSVGLKFQHRAVGIMEHLDPENLITTGFQPKAPYYIWTHYGGRYGTKSIADAKSLFAEDERPCSQLEVTSLFIHFPELFKGGGLDSGSTVFKDDYYSTLIWVQSYPELAAHHLNDFTAGLSVLSRGKLKEEG